MTKTQTEQSLGESYGRGLHRRPRSKLRNALEYAPFFMVTRGLRLCSHGSTRRWGRRLGRWAYPLIGSRRRLVLTNIELALPELDDAARRRVARESFAEFGAMTLETLSGARLTEEDLERLVRIEGMEHVDEARARGKGLLFYTGHFGSPEIVAHAFGRKLGGIHVVNRPLSNPLVDREMRAIRTRYGNQLIDKHGAVRKLYRLLAKGESVGMLIDQRASSPRGVILPFFGRPALTYTVLGLLALATEAPLLPAFCFPEGKDGYRLEVHPPIEPAQGETEASLTLKATAILEAEIRKRPELWLWMQRRWRLGWPEGAEEQAREDAALVEPAADSEQR